MRSKPTNSSTRNRRTQNPLPGQISYIDAVGLSTRKTRGEAAEAAFLAKAASFGFGIAKPWGDSERYDFILDSGERIWRVQVKSTESHKRTGYALSVMASNRGYNSEEIDFVVCYLVPEQMWYVIPVEVLGERKGVYLYGKSRGGLYEQYREAWCQMACRRKSKDLNLVNVERRCQQGRPCPRK